MLHIPIPEHTNLVSIPCNDYTYVSNVEDSNDCSLTTLDSLTDWVCFLVLDIGNP
jgi:hypothetical protein